MPAFSHFVNDYDWIFIIKIN